MRFSAWSSRSIWVCSALAALAVAPAAFARLSINPDMIEQGKPVALVFAVPNDHDRYGVNHVTLGIPPEFQLYDAEAKPGWTQSRTQQAVSWSGGLIPLGQYATFSVRGTAPANPENVLFNVVVGDRTGKSYTDRVALSVVPQPQEDTGARTLAKAALIVAIVAGALALGAGSLGLWLWLRPREPEPDGPDL